MLVFRPRRRSGRGVGCLRGLDLGPGRRGATRVALVVEDDAVCVVVPREWDDFSVPVAEVWLVAEMSCDALLVELVDRQRCVSLCGYDIDVVEVDGVLSVRDGGEATFGCAAGGFASVVVECGLGDWANVIEPVDDRYGVMSAAGVDVEQDAVAFWFCFAFTASREEAVGCVLEGSTWLRGVALDLG